MGEKDVEEKKKDFLEMKVNELMFEIQEKRSLVVAFSGGVDSSVVAAIAYKALGERALALTVDSPLLPPGELEYARAVAKRIGINHDVVKFNELEIAEFKENPPNRCYLCKKFRFGKLIEMAHERGFGTVADGTNLSDLGEYRLGLKAAEELGIYSPLLEAGLSKSDIREIAQQLDLPTFGKPASPCLATRIPYGQELTQGRLKRIADAESYVESVTDVKVIRVREHDDLARIEVGLDERRLFFNEQLLNQITQKLKQLGYEFVTFDMEGYRFGSFDEVMRAK